MYILSKKVRNDLVSTPSPALRDKEHGKSFVFSVARVPFRIDATTSTTCKADLWSWTQFFFTCGSAEQMCTVQSPTHCEHQLGNLSLLTHLCDDFVGAGIRPTIWKTSVLRFSRCPRNNSGCLRCVLDCFKRDLGFKCRTAFVFCLLFSK